MSVTNGTALSAATAAANRPPIPPRRSSNTGTHLPNTKKRPYKAVMEPILEKKKKLRTISTANKNPPRGHTFVPAGIATITAPSKEMCRVRGLSVYVVSMTANLDKRKIGGHVQTLGYHFPTPIVQTTCSRANYIIRNGRIDIGDATNPQKPNRRPAQPLDIHNPDITVKRIVDGIKDIFPCIPDRDAEAIARHAFREGTNRVGTALDIPLARRIQLAVVAYIRHHYTDYDNLLRTTNRRSARAKIESACRKVLICWRGESDTNQDEWEEIFREVIVLDDDDSEDECISLSDGETPEWSDGRDDTGAGRIRAMSPKRFTHDVVVLSSSDDEGDTGVDTVAPCAPVRLDSPVQSVKPVKPVEFIQAARPSQPFEAVRVVNPAQFIGPGRSAGSIEPGEVNGSTKTAEEIDLAWDVCSERLIQLVQSAQSLRPTQSVECTEPVQRVVPVEPVQTVRPVEPALAFHPLPPLASVQSVKPVKAVQRAKRVRPPKSVKSAPARSTIPTPPRLQLYHISDNFETDWADSFGHDSTYGINRFFPLHPRRTYSSNSRRDDDPDYESDEVLGVVPKPTKKWTNPFRGSDPPPSIEILESPQPRGQVVSHSFSETTSENRPKTTFIPKTFSSTTPASKGFFSNSFDPAITHTPPTFQNPFLSLSLSGLDPTLSPPSPMPLRKRRRLATIEAEGETQLLESET